MPRNSINPIFVPHEGCPHACVFCSQQRITGKYVSITLEKIEEAIGEGFSVTPPHKKVEIAFYGGSFTCIAIERQREILSVAHSFCDDVRWGGIRISTRPDAIDEPILTMLKQFGVHTIELGVQSMCEEVLDATKRGHNTDDVKRAVTLIRQNGFRLGLQMMTGLPHDTFDRAVETARALCDFSPDFVRIYPTVVLRGTELHEMYEKGEYQPQTLSEAVDVCAVLLKLFDEKNIPVIRVGLQATTELSHGDSVVAGVYHPAFRELVEGEIYRAEMLSQLQAIEDFEGNVTIRYPKGERSKVVGHKKVNAIFLQEKFPQMRFGFEESKGLSRYRCEMLCKDRV